MNELLRDECSNDNDVLTVLRVRVCLTAGVCLFVLRCLCGSTASFVWNCYFVWIC